MTTTDKVHRGRKTLTEQLRIRFDKRNFGPELEAIVSKGITAKKRLTTALAVKKLNAEIGRASCRERV